MGAGDSWALKQVHEEILAKIEDKEARASAEAQTKTEFQTQFPNYKGPWPPAPNMLEEALYDERNKAQIRDVITQINIIVKEMKADPFTDGQPTNYETFKAVTDLWQIFAPKKGEVIKTGLHFPLGILKQLSILYDTQFNSWGRARLAFISRTVIGGALAALSAVDGQCVKNGLSKLNKYKGPDRTDGLFCRHPKGIPADKAPLVGKLGRVVFVDPMDGASCFLSSTPSIFDWYHKGGDTALGWDSGILPLFFARPATATLFDNLWKKKCIDLAGVFSKPCLDSLVHPVPSPSANLRS